MTQDGFGVAYRHRKRRTLHIALQCFKGGLPLDWLADEQVSRGCHQVSACQFQRGSYRSSVLLKDGWAQRFRSACRRSRFASELLAYGTSCSRRRSELRDRDGRETPVGVVERSSQDVLRYVQVMRSWVEWTRYEAEPSGLTLAPLARRAEREGGSMELIEHIAALWRANRNWRLAQHLVLLHRKHGRLTEAWYFADRAVADSGRDPSALAALCAVYEERRLPHAALPLLDELRLRVRRLKRGPKRATLHAYMAEARVRSHAYLHDIQRASRWLRMLRYLGGGEVGTMYQLLNAADGVDEEIALVAATALLSVVAAPPDRPKARITRLLRSALLRQLRERHAQRGRDDGQ